MPTIHAIHGYICSGKTTFAKNLEREKNALRFTYDEWQNTIFKGEDAKAIGFKYGSRIKNLIYKHYSRALNIGIDVILDDGFWRIIERQNIKKYAESIDAELKLYNVVCSFDKMRDRLKKRNEVCDNYSSIISETDFDNSMSFFQPLLSGEIRIEIDSSDYEPLVSIP